MAKGTRRSPQDWQACAEVFVKGTTEIKESLINKRLNQAIRETFGRETTTDEKKRLLKMMMDVTVLEEIVSGENVKLESWQNTEKTYKVYPGQIQYMNLTGETRKPDLLSRKVGISVYKEGYEVPEVLVERELFPFDGERAVYSLKVTKENKEEFKDFLVDLKRNSIKVRLDGSGCSDPEVLGVIEKFMAI